MCRSGAKVLTRAGRSILAIQHLGRRASAQVLEYIEEACAERKGAPLWKAGGPLPALEERIRALEAAREALCRGAPPPAEEAMLARPAPPAPTAEVLWAVLGEGHSKKLHVQASARPSAPSWAWATRFGWRFAGAPGLRLLEVSKLPESVTWCRKCAKGVISAAAEPGGQAWRRCVRGIGWGVRSEERGERDAYLGHTRARHACYFVVTWHAIDSQCNIDS